MIHSSDASWIEPATDPEASALALAGGPSAKRPLRLAVISAYLFDGTIGGVENHIRFLAKELAARGHVLAVIKPVWEQDSPCTVRILDGIEVHYVSIGKRPADFCKRAGNGYAGHAWALGEKLAFTLGARKVCRAVDRWRPDVVWQHDFFSSWLTTRLLSARYPAVLTNHQGQYLFLQRTRIGRRFASWILRHYDAIIGPSKELTPPGPRAHTIYNGVDTRFFRPLGDRERRELRETLYGANAKRLILFCPRRWAPTKGVLFYANALRKFERTHSGNLPLAVFAGDGNSAYMHYRREVRSAVDALKSPTLLLGDLDVYRLRPYYQTADLVIIPSLLEAVSLAALEAMACGTPVLATSVGGMPELIQDENGGYLVAPGSTEAILHGLNRFVTCDSHETLRAAARARVEESFGWERIADETEAVLESARCARADRSIWNARSTA